MAEALINRRPPMSPRPELLRGPRGGFGWLEVALLHDGWLREIGPHAAAVMLLLALAADRRCASFFNREGIAVVLNMSRHEVDATLQRLLDAGLVDLRPWRAGGPDGVWQLLPIPARQHLQRSRRCLTTADVLHNLGFHSQ